MLEYNAIYRVIADCVVVLALGGLSAYGVKTQYTKDHPNTPNARISITDVVLAPLDKVRLTTGYPFINVMYKNAGTATVLDEHLVATILITEHKLTPVEEDVQQDRLIKDDDDKRDPQKIYRREYYSNDAGRFYSLPLPFGMREAKNNYPKILDGKLGIYLFVTFKYHDSSLPKKKTVITEACFSFQRSLTFNHTCGRVRTFITPYIDALSFGLIPSGLCRLRRDLRPLSGHSAAALASPPFNPPAWLALPHGVLGWIY